MKKINLRLALLVVVSIFLILGITYKYFEWNTLKTLSDLYNSSWKNEFKIVEQNTKKYDDLAQFQNTIFNSKDPDSFSKNYIDLNSKLNLLTESEQQYLSTIKDSRDKYINLQKSTAFLIGQRGDFAKKLIDLQIKYYNDEIESGQRGDANLYLESDLYSLWNDKGLVDSFDKKISPDAKTNIPKYFADIAPLQSYTKSDFTLNHSDEIKQYFPDGYDALNKYKDYLSNYYIVVQDIVNGDYNSAAYNYTTISNNISNLTLNFKGIFSSGKDQQIERSKNIADEVSNGITLIKQFKKNNLGKYPILPAVSIWKEDLVLCQLYDFKSTTIYHNVTSKYPSSKNFSDLLNELSDVNPKTDSVDKDFNKSIVTYTNDDKKIEFKCKDIVDGDTLTFSFTKPESK